MGLSLIQWTKYTYNPWLGCRKVAPECEKCYIVRQTPLRVRGIKHGSERHRCAESTLKQPLAWNKEPWVCLKCGISWAIPGSHSDCDGEQFCRARVFCLSLGDWLDNEVPIEWLTDLLAMIHKCQNLDWQLLTKRPQNFKTRMALVLQYCDDELAEWLKQWTWSKENGYGNPPPNVWIGVSAGADQRAALDIPAKIHFLSCEPMIHEMDKTYANAFNWIIFGGESEPGGEPRPFDVINLDRALKFCRENQIPAFVKQMGGAPVFSHDRFDDSGIVTAGWRKDVTFPGGCTIKLGDGHGGDMEQWPERFRVREFPKAI